MHDRVKDKRESVYQSERERESARKRQRELGRERGRGRGEGRGQTDNTVTDTATRQNEQGSTSHSETLIVALFARVVFLAVHSSNSAKCIQA